jgi:hypothetical protein
MTEDVIRIKEELERELQIHLRRQSYDGNRNRRSAYEAGSPYNALIDADVFTPDKIIVEYQKIKEKKSKLPFSLREAVEMLYLRSKIRAARSTNS